MLRRGPRPAARTAARHRPGGELLAAGARGRCAAAAADPASSDDPAPVRAPWCGLGVELIPAGGWRHGAAEVVELRITLAHRRVDELPLPLALLRAQRGRRARDRCVTQVRRWADRLTRASPRSGRAALDAYDTAEQAGT